MTRRKDKGSRRRKRGRTGGRDSRRPEHNSSPRDHSRGVPMPNAPQNSEGFSLCSPQSTELHRKRSQGWGLWGKQRGMLFLFSLGLHFPTYEMGIQSPKGKARTRSTYSRCFEQISPTSAQAAMTEVQRAGSCWTGLWKPRDPRGLAPSLNHLPSSH